MSDPIVLREGQTKAVDSLNMSELAALRTLIPSLRVSPRLDGDGVDITPGSVIGAVQLGDRPVVIRPKFDMPHVLFLAVYALDPRMFRVTPEHPQLAPDSDLTTAIAPMFIRWANHAIARGLLQGYRTVEESSMTVRGRIRFDDQMRRRGSLPLPIEVTYDDYTDDIVENQLLRAAVKVLRHLIVRSAHYRGQLRALDARLQSVSVPRFDHNIPDPPTTRINRRYAPALKLARLILSHASVDLEAGGVACTSLLFDMNKVFENFVTVALRETLGLNERNFPQNARRHRLRLDRAERVTLLPDLSWWSTGRPIFVGDVKYKRVSVEGIEHPDLYQLLAYTVAADLPGGLLIYAAGEAGDVTHVVEANGKRLLVRTLDLAQPPEAVLRRIDNLGQLVRQLARSAAGSHVSPLSA